MKSDMAHMTAVSISSHRNPRCILRERRLASEGCPERGSRGGDVNRDSVSQIEILRQPFLLGGC